MEDVLKLCEKYNIPVLNYTDDRVYIDESLCYYKDNGYRVSYDIKSYSNKIKYLEYIEEDMKMAVYKRKLLESIFPMIKISNKKYIKNLMMKEPYILLSKDNISLSIYISNSKTLTRFTFSIYLPYILSPVILLDFI